MGFAHLVLEERLLADQGTRISVPLNLQRPVVAEHDRWARSHQRQSFEALDIVLARVVGAPDRRAVVRQTLVSPFAVVVRLVDAARPADADAVDEDGPCGAEVVNVWRKPEVRAGQRGTEVC